MHSKLPSILLGGAAAAVLVSVFTVLQEMTSDIVGIVTCLSYASCGLIAVWHYTNEHSLTLSGKEGVGLGALSGVAAGVIGSLISYLLRLLGAVPNKEEALAEARLAMEEAGAAGGPATAWTEGFIEFMYGLGGIAVGIVFGVVLGIAGGAIGRAIWKKGTEAE